MSKLELQLSTVKAQAQLAQVEKSIASLSGALQGIGRSTTEFDRLVRSMAGFKGINRTSVTNIEKMNLALRGLRVPQGLSQLGASLSAISSVNLRGVASSIGTFAKNLDRIKIPKNLQTISNQLLQISNSASLAATSMERFRSATTGIRTPPALAGINRQMNRMPGAFSSANSAAMQFNNSIRTMRNLSGGLAAALGAFGAKQFIQGATQATMTMEQFHVVMKTVTGSSEGAADSLAFIKQLSQEMAIPVNQLAVSFSKFSAASLSAGFTMDKNKQIVSSFSKAFRVLGLSTQDQRLGFLALEQMISKGTVSSEELRRQLGERLPGAFNLAAQAIGVSTAELQKMLQNGEVATSDFLPKFAKTVEETFGTGLPDSLQKTSAALARMESAWFVTQQAFGDSFWASAKDSVNALAAAMETESFKSFASDMGAIAGIIASGLISGIQFLTENTILLKGAFAGLAGVGVISMLSGVFGLLNILASPIAATVKSLGMMHGAFIALGGVSGMMNVLRLAIVGVTVASRALALTPLGLAMTAMGIAAITAAQHFGLFEKAASALGFTSSETAKSAEEQAQATQKVADAQKGAFAHLVRTDSATLKMGQSFKTSSSSTNEFAAATQQSVAHLAEQGVVMKTAGGEAASAATQFGKTADEQSNVASSSAQATSQLQRNAQAAEEARKKYEALARAAREAASAMRSADGGGIRAGAQRKGGMAGAAVQSQAVSASAFKNAPQFAEGTANTNAYMPTVPGGGIPSILHPNEAVVPLSGGRSIPVQIKSGPAGSSASFSGTNDREVVSQLIRIVDVLNSIQAGGGVPAMSSNGRVGGTIGGSFSIGASTGSRSRSVGTMSAKDRIDSIAAKRKEIEDRRKAEADALNALTSIEDTLVETKDVIKNSFNSLTPIQQMTDMLRRANRQLTQGRGAAGGGAGTLASAGMGDLSGRLEGSSMASFSRGSPNAFNEAQGRSATVRIHPDEAVIPLPNGRAVPVTFPAERAGGGYSGGHPGGTGSTQNVEIGGITIMANNPREFEESSAQMEAKVRQRMARAVSRRGLTEGPR
jgi:tape measure domain-containing protein